MAIKYPLEYALGSNKVQSFPKVQYAKIVEIIDAVNDLTDGDVSLTDLSLAGTLAVTGATTLTGQAALSGGLTVGKATVTQITAITTGVTINASAGVITTVSSTLAAGANGSFKVTNSKATSTSVIQLTADDKATAGWARVNVQDVAAGEFYINVTNIHPTNAFNGVIKIHFLVV